MGAVALMGLLSNNMRIVSQMQQQQQQQQRQQQLVLLAAAQAAGTVAWAAAEAESCLGGNGSSSGQTLRWACNNRPRGQLAGVGSSSLDGDSLRAALHSVHGFCHVPAWRFCRGVCSYSNPIMHRRFYREDVVMADNYSWSWCHGIHLEHKSVHFTCSVMSFSHMHIWESHPAAPVWLVRVQAVSMLMYGDGCVDLRLSQRWVAQHGSETGC
jgi:hypothetical protein